MADRLVPGTYASIQDGIDAATAGDRVLVSGGTYAEGDLARIVANITIEGVDGETVIIDSTGYVNFSKAYTGWTYKNLEMTGCSQDGIVGNGNNRRYVVEDCHIHDWGTTSAHYALRGYVDGSVHQRNFIHHGPGHGSHAGFHYPTMTPSEVRASVYYECGGQAVVMPYAGCIAEGITAAKCASLSATIHASIVRNSIVIANTPGVGIGINAVATHDRNIANGYLTPFTGAAVDSGSSTGDPLLTDPGSYDFTPTAATPTGSASATTVTDVIGATFAVPPTTGAYQYVVPGGGGDPEDPVWAVPAEYSAVADALADSEARSPDWRAPSESFIDCDDAEDVWTGDLYSMLTLGTRMWDEQSGGVFEPLLVTPTELIHRHMQKTWRLACLIKYDETPDEMLKYLRAHVGFGAGQGAATDLAERLDYATTRVLIKVAAKFWARRGRPDSLVDSIRFFASAVRPWLRSWNWLAPQVDELAVGAEGTPNTDLWTLTSEHHDGLADSDAWVSFLRVPDYGNLDRQLVEDLVNLGRPAHERFDVAYVDFLDTFADGRLSHWYSPNLSPSEWSAGDSSTEPETLAGLVLSPGDCERAVTPASESWSGYTLHMVLFVAEDAVFGVRFLSVGGSHYELIFDTSAQTATLKSLVTGSETTLAIATGVDVVTPLMGVLQIDTEVGADSTFVRVSLGEELVLEHSAATGLGRGSFEVFCASGGDVRVSMVELFEHPLAVSVLEG